MNLEFYELERILTKSKKISNGCWLWYGSKTSDGYARINFRGNPNTRVHIIMYNLIYGKVPIGLVLDHLCRARNCINPHHLEPVTRGENVLRGDTLAAKAKAATHCSSGHEYNEENTYITKKGHRDCRTCGRIQAREYRNRIGLL